MDHYPAPGGFVAGPEYESADAFKLLKRRRSVAREGPAALCCLASPRSLPVLSERLDATSTEPSAAINHRGRRKTARRPSRSRYPEVRSALIVSSVLATRRNQSLSLLRSLFRFPEPFAIGRRDSLLSSFEIGDKNAQFFIGNSISKPLESRERAELGPRSPIVSASCTTRHGLYRCQRDTASN